MTTPVHSAVDHNDPSLEQLQRIITNAERGAVAKYSDNQATLDEALEERQLSMADLINMIVPTYRLSNSDSHTSLTQKALQKMHIDPKMLALRDGDTNAARAANSKLALLVATVARAAVNNKTLQAEIDALKPEQQHAPMVAACA